ncbi:hypothetical protein OOK29_00015 [Streptomyces phaeochromogenes]|uniref:hypothetical protein n=1 Tax=Streptomyces phaeochromogenes TaxID=1923 RepID=UPI002257C485|nr:hypothetical protein [Streptomyces phaeochromogenes]MCX5596523.1 hypothetical protein [Streptomyces phaeochromogenes]
MVSQQPPQDEWQQLKPDAEHALSHLLSEISAHSDPQSLFEAYTYAKDITARAIQARMLMHLPSESPQFRSLHARVQQRMRSHYKETIPERLLGAPYGGKTHERLFSLLHESLARPVPAAMLRIVTGDDVHTERRARELRELGLDVDWYEVEGINVYELRSLDLDFDMIPAIVRNKVRQTKSLSKEEKQRVLKNSGISEDG